MSKNTITKPITKRGLKRKLYAATRKSDHDKLFIQRFIELSRDGTTFIKPRQITANKTTDKAGIKSG
jgi:hypothetical protein